MITRFSQNNFDKEFDLIIIGGGINGTGIAREASERGLKVLLLEKNDFASGCTAYSTRLIHGGLRYLEYFEISLVQESLAEREILLKNANHLVSPLELCIPVYKNDKRPLWEISLGMALYDFLSISKSLPSHRILSKLDFIAYEPNINSSDLIGSAVYYDSQITYPERICLENVLMANFYGAVTLNHAEVVEVKLENNLVKQLRFIDKLNGKDFFVSGKCVVNVSGPWVDNVCKLFNSNIKRLIGGTKGSHIVVNKSLNGPTHAVYTSAKKDGRPFFIIPWLDFYLIGTTDIIFNGDLEKVSADVDEIDYLISEANNVFLNLKLSKNDVLYSYSGVRPLPYVDSKTPGSITRKHIIHDHFNDGIHNLFSIVGGKLTTYRNLSEQFVDSLFFKLKMPNILSKSKHIPLLGCLNSDPKSFISSNYATYKDKISLNTFKHLISIYGSRYFEVLKSSDENSNLLEPITPGLSPIKAEILFSFKELAYTVSDVMARRLPLVFNSDLGESQLPFVLESLKKQFNYSSQELESQSGDYFNNLVKLRKTN